MDRSAANHQGNVWEVSENFTLSGDWSPYIEYFAKSLKISQGHCNYDRIFSCYDTMCERDTLHHGVGHAYA